MSRDSIISDTRGMNDMNTYILMNHAARHIGLIPGASAAVFEHVQLLHFFSNEHAWSHELYAVCKEGKLMSPSLWSLLLKLDH